MPSLENPPEVLHTTLPLVADALRETLSESSRGGTVEITQWEHLEEAVIAVKAMGMIPFFRVDTSEKLQEMMDFKERNKDLSQGVAMKVSKEVKAEMESRARKPLIFRWAGKTRQKLGETLGEEWRRKSLGIFHKEEVRDDSHVLSPLREAWVLEDGDSKVPAMSPSHFNDEEIELDSGNDNDQERELDSEDDGEMELDSGDDGEMTLGSNPDRSAVELFMKIVVEEKPPSDGPSTEVRRNGFHEPETLESVSLNGSFGSDAAHWQDGEADLVSNDHGTWVRGKDGIWREAEEVPEEEAPDPSFPPHVQEKTHTNGSHPQSVSLNGSSKSVVPTPPDVQEVTANGFHKPETPENVFLNGSSENDAAHLNGVSSKDKPQGLLSRVGSFFSGVRNRFGRRP